MKKFFLHVDFLIVNKNSVVGAKLSNPATGESKIVKATAFTALQGKSIGLDNGYARKTRDSYTICSKEKPFERVTVEALPSGILQKLGLCRHTA